MFDLTGKSALVTGSTRGIGLAIARTLAAHGAHVFICGTCLEDSRRVASGIQGATAVAADLSQPDAPSRLFAETGPVDVVVANASVQYRRPWQEIPDEELMQQLRVNYISTLRLFALYAEPMKERGYGRLITVGSVQQYKPHKDMLVYAGSKAAQMSMVENLAKQLAPYGITVNNLAPGVINTKRNEKALSDEAYREAVLQQIPLGRIGTADDCAAAALLLASKEGGYMTGIDLIVDGGMHL